MPPALSLAQKARSSSSPSRKWHLFTRPRRRPTETRESTAFTVRASSTDLTSINVCDPPSFAVHPTGFFGPSWNAPLDDPKANEQTDIFLATQASAFAESCRVYAPRYRQATLGAFFYHRESGIQALQLAYEDVRQAFLYYMQHYNQGRPFVLASHSQGGWHLSRLLEEEVDAKPAVLAQFIVAYLIGSGLPRSRFSEMKHIQPSRAATDLQCVCGWDTRSAGLQPPLSSFVGHWYRSGWRCAGPEEAILGTSPYTWQDPHPNTNADADATLGTSPYTWQDAGDLQGRAEDPTLHRGFLFAQWYDPQGR